MAKRSRREPGLPPVPVWSEDVSEPAPGSSREGGESRSTSPAAAAGIAVAIVGALVLVFGAALVIVSRDDKPERVAQPLPTEEATPDPSPTEPLPDPSPAAVAPTAIRVSPSERGPDHIVVSATGADAAPWLSFELCGTDPPGCIPVWTYELRQAGSKYEADLRLPGSFVAPDSYPHTCAADSSCELRVRTTDSSAVFPLDPSGEDPAGLAADPEADGGSDQLVVVVPERLVEGQPAQIAVEHAVGDALLEFWLCPPRVLDEQCRRVHRHRADQAGSAEVELVLPRLISAHERTNLAEGPSEIDCAGEPCRLRVGDSSGWTEVVLGFDAAGSQPPAPAVALESSTVTPGDTVMATGTGFPVISPTHRSTVRWLLCDELPGSLEEVPVSCGSPRTTRAAAVNPDGAFQLSVRVPSPNLVRTWVGDRPLACASECWLIFLNNPFPRLVATQLAIG